jgi:hypothetical protein
VQPVKLAAPTPRARGELAAAEIVLVPPVKDALGLLAANKEAYSVLPLITDTEAEYVLDPLSESVGTAAKKPETPA